MELDKDTIASIAAISAAQVMEILGVSAGTMSRNQVRKTYGVWAIKAIKDGRLRPVSKGKRKEFYSIQQIMTLRLEDSQKAKIQIQ